MNAGTQAGRTVETFLANLLIQIGASIKTDTAFRPDINYDLQNRASVILLVEDAIRELKMLDQKTANPGQDSERVATLKPESAQKPKVSFEVHSEVLCKSAVREQVHLRIYKQQEGTYFIEDEELNAVRKLVLTGAL